MYVFIDVGNIDRYYLNLNLFDISMSIFIVAAVSANGKCATE